LASRRRLQSTRCSDHPRALTLQSYL
jgi:hypothetical protein